MPKNAFTAAEALRVAALLTEPGALAKSSQLFRERLRAIGEGRTVAPATAAAAQ